ncbi:MAG: class I SAM-dependent methyltransferase [Moraxellaceae bacterium]|nr:class I SAM-dependent methyltransferase [Moraxellaceae bacterium]MDP1775864.1 class I SAM-dependent methyltransferase [Moraxellaceae bacterium]MDZ4299118.1 class I SAM-dependent methyltransferase [Moraxellaceae bacterium]MDZ4386691.1 class I SAM-dependent methyltransferase [Moraxellaceae bacterium]
MKLYNKHILPHLIDCACGLGAVMGQRAKLVPLAYGNVLEIGIGTGLNLEFYDATRVQKIVGVDPAAEMHPLAAKRAKAITIPVETVALELEQVAAPEHSFDSIVCTFTLCTIPDPVAALKEMRRVLKPNGVLLFCEHGLAPDLTVQRWQQRITPWWKPFAGGCHLDRDVYKVLSDGGFTITEVSSQYLKGPRAWTYVTRGQAVIKQ